MLGLVMFGRKETKRQRETKRDKKRLRETKRGTEILIEHVLLKNCAYQ
jgi:hypothetical protein